MSKPLLINQNQVNPTITSKTKGSAYTYLYFMEYDGRVLNAFVLLLLCFYLYLLVANHFIHLLIQI